MAGTWGNMLRLSIFGESHGRGIGVVIDGLPAGEEIDLSAVEAQMKRRAPGQSALTTPRTEADSVEILSGFHNGKATGSPIGAVIFNKDARSQDYDSKLRPGHADLTALLKYGGHADMRGGGHFSGRITAPLVFAGAIARQVLARRGLDIFGRIKEIAGIEDGLCKSREDFLRILEKSFAVADDAAGERMQSAILAAKEDGDSVGGVVEIAAFGAPAGLGEPFFRSVESEIARFLFSVPAVKGVEFGGGFPLSRLRGSQSNDAIIFKDGKIQTLTNNAGGIQGGITNGMPIILRAAIKPTSTIAIEQDTLDGKTLEPVKITSGGRHDPCIVTRALPVIESVVALCLLDLLMEQRGRSI
ncbi:MAG: chorismate synthase [Christensenellales bacterium]|jgi:chorismate synthase